jgi:uncharacterized protein (TIRG00374 family)
MRKFLGALALMLGVYFMLTRFAELNKVVEVLQRGSLIFLGLALLVEAVWIYNLGTFYQSIYRVLGMQVRRWHVIRLVTAGYFLSVVAPSAGLSSMAVYIDDAKRHGRSMAKVTVATILYIWFEYVGTFSIALLGMAELSSRRDLHWSEITASLVLLGGALGIGLMLYLGMHSANALGKMLAFLTRLVNAVVRPFIHRDYLQESRAYAFSIELTEGVAVLRENPRWIFWPLLFTIVNKALLIALLACCFSAFGVEVDLGTLIAGHSIAHVFLIVSPTPGGIGFVEGVLALSLASLGVPLGDATVVTLAYRAFSFWVPFFFGMVMFRSLGIVQGPARPIHPPVGGLF